MREIDIIFALIAGEATAWLFVGLLKGIPSLAGIKALYWLLPVLFPVMALAGLWLSYLIGKKFLFVFQAAKFFLLGILATLVDLAVLNLLISVSGIASGGWYPLFKGMSFLVAMSGKYFGVKFWTFSSSAPGFGEQGRKKMGKELVQFLLISSIGLAINVAAASFVVNAVGPQLNIAPKVWANIGAILAAFVAFIWNFIGSKFIVFKK